MSFESTVLYPAEGDATFDMDYYCKTHMPLVSEKWKQYGLKGWRVVEFQSGPDGTKPHFSVQATLLWENEDALKKAMSSSEASAVFGDVPNFSNKGPTLISGSVMKTEGY